MACDLQLQVASYRSNCSLGKGNIHNVIFPYCAKESPHQKIIATPQNHRNKKESGNSGVGISIIHVCVEIHFCYIDNLFDTLQVSKTFVNVYCMDKF